MLSCFCWRCNWHDTARTSYTPADCNHTPSPARIRPTSRKYHSIPRTVEEQILIPTLDRTYSGHTCHPTDPHSIQCTGPDTSVAGAETTTTTYSNLYAPDIQNWTEKTQILPYVYDAYTETYEINYCCKVRSHNTNPRA